MPLFILGDGSDEPDPTDLLAAEKDGNRQVFAIHFVTARPHQTVRAIQAGGGIREQPCPPPGEESLCFSS